MMMNYLQSLLLQLNQYKQTTNNMDKKTFDLLDSFFPKMTPTQQKKMLRQLVKEANEDSRKQALLDPLARIPRA